MDDPEQTPLTGGNVEAPPAPPTSVTETRSTHSATSHVETCADRTGELVEAVAEVLAGQFRPVVVTAQEPGTNVVAPMALIAGSNVLNVPESIFDEYRTNPKRLVAKPGLTRLDSFIALVNRHKLPNSVVFAQESEAQPAMQAIVDYHGESVTLKGVEVDDPIEVHPSTPEFGNHVISYPFPLSPEWKGWIEQNGKPMSMAEFAAFLEDRIVDVEQVDDPGQALSKEALQYIAAARGVLATPTQLFELSTGLSVNTRESLVEARKLQSGEGQLTFKTEHTDAAGNTLNVPSMFIICIPIWAQSTDYYRLIARLRFRATSGGILFWYELWRADLTFRAAIDEVVKQVEEQTTLPVFIGRAV